VLERYAAKIGGRVDKPEFLDPLERSDRENAVQEHLEDAGVDQAWEIAPSLVSLGLGVGDFTALREHFGADRLAPAITALARQYERRSLLGSLEESTDRTIEIVKALKSYTYLDQAPHQLVDVHEGLDSTLVMLQDRLRTGIEVHRAYADDLPAIEAYGSELNQVWTNILANAIDAMDAEGAITIATRATTGQVVVEITDSGPGIPAELAPQIFDPFVTTKAPGEGTGLGLNISHNIITQKHSGEITVSSEPGRTTFTVRLPLEAPTEGAPDPTKTGGRAAGPATTTE
jgi:signal transduction histidine kinase